MNKSTGKLQHEVDAIYKSHYGKIVASLLNFSQTVSLETIEDVVQDAFASALTAWDKWGIPANPAGWIFTVCRNKILNKIKEGKRLRPLLDDEDFDTTGTVFSDTVFDDQQLQLLFACANPDLSPKAQVVITLKYVANLKVEAIAKVLGMTIDGIDKLLLRARQKIRDEKILMKMPPLAQLKTRLPVVHKIIYLIYNEGYKSSSGKEVLREELCEDALLMNKALLDNKLGDHNTAALYALMLFNAARFKARFGPSGELLELEEQDRSLWNRGLILLGTDFLHQSSAGLPVSTYHYEASIAYTHCIATSFQSTNWKVISGLYLQLLQIGPNPFVELNYAIALYYAGEKEKALNILNTLKQHPFLNQYYLLNAALGKIYLQEGEHTKAKQFLLQTLEQAPAQAEKEYVLKLMQKIRE